VRVLLAGGAGFLGSWVADELVANDHEVVVLDNLISGDRRNIEAVAGVVEIVEADIRDAERLRSIAGPFDCVVHLAFPTPLCTRDPAMQFHDIAGLGTANLLDLAMRNEAWFLYGSSISVYGRQTVIPITEAAPAMPMLVYGANKLLGETLCAAYHQMYDLRYRALRLSDLYGPRDRRSAAIPNFLKAAQGGGEIRISGGGDQRRTYTFVRDAAAAIRMALAGEPAEEILNVAAPHAVSISALAEQVRDELALSVNIVHESGPADPRDYVFSAEKFRTEIGEVPWTSLDDGLRETFESMPH
jgi:nucleoside-diphosphate-sugar epimerase